MVQDNKSSERFGHGGTVPYMQSMDRGTEGMFKVVAEKKNHPECYIAQCKKSPYVTIRLFPGSERSVLTYAV